MDASVRGDIDHTKAVENMADPTAPSRDGVTGRVLPQLSVDWRLPLVRTEGGARQIVEPIVVLVASPNGGNPTEIPNEDSLSFEFDDANLFSANRFPGLDRVEGGLRINYGLRLATYGRGGGRSDLLLGPTWRRRNGATFSMAPERPRQPNRLTRPKGGRKPVTPHRVHGDTMRPRVSVPMENPSSPAAVAAAGPADDPLDPCSVFQGFFVVASNQTSPHARAPTDSLAMSTAPACSSRETTVAFSGRTCSLNGLAPHVVG